jgi:hypothetical protein
MPWVDIDRISPQPQDSINSEASGAYSQTWDFTANVPGLADQQDQGAPVPIVLLQTITMEGVTGSPGAGSAPPATNAPPDWFDLGEEYASAPAGNDVPTWSAIQYTEVIGVIPQGSDEVYLSGSKENLEALYEANIHGADYNDPIVYGFPADSEYGADDSEDYWFSGGTRNATSGHFVEAGQIFAYEATPALLAYLCGLDEGNIYTYANISGISYQGNNADAVDGEDWKPEEMLDWGPDYQFTGGGSLAQWYSAPSANIKQPEFAPTLVGDGPLETLDATWNVGAANVTLVPIPDEG